MAVVPAGGASRRQFWPRERVLVRYKDDPVLWHARWLLSKAVAGSLVTVLTPDRDIMDTELGSTEVYTDVVAWPGDAMPNSRVKQRDVYADAQSHNGAFKRGELDRLYARYDGKDAGGNTHAVLAPRVRMRSKADHDGEGSGGTVVAWPTTFGDLKLEKNDERVWMRVYSTDRTGIADSTPAPPPAHASISLPYAIDLSKDPFFPDVFRLVSAAQEFDLSSRVNVLRQKKEARASFQEELNDELNSPRGSGTPPELGGIAGKGGSKEVKDCRVLPVLLDEGEERFRPLDDAAALMSQTDFTDWPLSGVSRSTKFVVKELRRNHKTFMTSNRDWVNHSGVRQTDRVIHEHRTLSKILRPWFQMISLTL